MRTFNAICRSIRLAHSETISRSASIAVMSRDGYLLMGKRRDSGLWTLPGGGINPGETALEGAQRELLEEAGLTNVEFIPLRQETVQGRTGRSVEIYAYQANAGHSERVRTSSKNDPDQEVAQWEWIWIGDGLPELIAAALQSPRNVTLDALGLL